MFSGCAAMQQRELDHLSNQQTPTKVCACSPSRSVQGQDEVFGKSNEKDGLDEKRVVRMLERKTSKTRGQDTESHTRISRLRLPQMWRDTDALIGGSWSRGCARGTRAMNGVAGKTSLDASGCLDAAVAWKSARVLHTNLVSPKALKFRQRLARTTTTPTPLHQPASRAAPRFCGKEEQGAGGGGGGGGGGA